LKFDLLSNMVAGRSMFDLKELVFRSIDIAD